MEGRDGILFLSPSPVLMQWLAPRRGSAIRAVKEESGKPELHQIKTDLCKFSDWARIPLPSCRTALLAVLYDSDVLVLDVVSLSHSFTSGLLTIPSYSWGLRLSHSSLYPQHLAQSLALSRHSSRHLPGEELSELLHGLVGYYFHR